MKRELSVSCFIIFIMLCLELNNKVLFKSKSKLLLFKQAQIPNIFQDLLILTF